MPLIKIFQPYVIPATIVNELTHFDYTKVPIPRAHPIFASHIYIDSPLPTCQLKCRSMSGKEFWIPHQQHVSWVVLRKLNSVLGTLYLFKNQALDKEEGLAIHFHPCFASKDSLTRERWRNPRPPWLLGEKMQFLLTICILFPSKLKPHKKSTPWALPFSLYPF